MANQKSGLIKIVYFDELSAIDYLEISNKGSQNKSSEKVTGKNVKGELKTKAGISSDSLLSKIINPILSLNLGAETSASISALGESVVKTSISNTVLSDYIEKADKDNRIIKLEDYTITTNSESFSYIKMLTPYFGMFNIPESGINIQNFDQVLEAGKGYYELIANSLINNDTKILRFNIKAFRNNYHLVDLTKMKIKLYGIKVGEATLESVKAGQEFSLQKQSVPDVKEIAEGVSRKETYFDLIDVVLVGIKEKP